MLTKKTTEGDECTSYIVKNEWSASKWLRGMVSMQFLTMTVTKS